MARSGCNSMRAPYVLVLVLLTGLGWGCRCQEQESKEPVAARGLAPLAGPSWQVGLGAGAVAAIPLGATERRRLVIGFHGNMDRPSWQCAAVRAMVGPEPFVLCPRGSAERAGQRVGWSDAKTAKAATRRALTELKQRFGDYLLPAPVVVFAYGNGVPMALQLARDEPHFFPRLVLIEGQLEGFSASLAGAYKARGGLGIAVVCGTERCRDLNRTPALFARRADLVVVERFRALGPQLGPRLRGEAATAYTDLTRAALRLGPVASAGPAPSATAPPGAE